MTSRKKQKKTAASLGLSERELILVETLEEVLGELRWLQILGYANQYLMNRIAKVDEAERDRVLEAATRAVDKDARLHEWRARLARVKDRAAHVKRTVAREKKALDREGRAPPAPPGEES